MTQVRRPPDAGQEAAAVRDPVTEARNLLEALRNLAFDAVTQKSERHYTKQHLRRTLKAHFRAMEVRINALAAYVPTKPEPAPGDASAPPATPA